MDTELEFYDDACGYPTARLKEITIYFNHSKAEEDARENCDRRHKRINYDNLFLIMYDREDITEADILRLKNIPCRGKIVLSHRKHPDIPYVKTMRPGTRLFGQQCIDKDWLGMRTFEKQFDYVTWLNQKEC